MKTIGILGGVGPQTTSKIYLSIIKAIRAQGNATYPPIVIYNLPFPFTIEHEAIVRGINSEKMIPYLIEGAKILEKSRVDFGILPCNTLHKYISEIRKAVGFSFLSILEETALALKNRNIKTVGILATKTTIESKIYETVLINHGIALISPPSNEQTIIGEVIVELLNDKRCASQSEKLEGICKRLVGRGAETILLACTDLQRVASNMDGAIPLMDTTEILINASVREIIKP